MGNTLKTKDYLNALKIYQINELNEQNNIFISIDLMYMKVNNEIKFIDINQNIINVDINSFLKVNRNYFGNNHLYAFQNVLYTKNKIQITSKSSINEINEDYLFNKDEYKLINNLSNINDNTILNFYSKISSFSFINNSIQTKEGINVKLELNNDLIKKISTNGISYFRNFIKKGNQILSTNLSYINTFEETFIQFFFYDYKIKDNLYDRLIFENNDIIIDNDIIKYKIKKKIKLRYYVDKIILKGNQKELTFYLYLYKGQINNVVCFINIEGGYFYEYIYQSLDSKNLPDSQNISNQAIYQYDSFQNKYKRRFNILNIKKQVINREEIIFTNDENKDIKVNTYYNDFNQWNSWQIFIIIKDIEYVFSETKIKMISEKKKINFEDNFEKELDKFYNEYKKKALISEEKEVFKKKYSLLFQDKYIIKENSEEDSDENKKKHKKFDLIEDFVQNKSTESIDDNENNNENNSYNYQKYLSEGFAEYDFENNKKQYLQIKKLSFLIICKFLDSDDLNEGISGLKSILFKLKKKIYIDYIDKIRILITYINRIIFSSKHFLTELCFLEDRNYGKILSNAHNFLISIYDKLKEESSLYKIFSQYNTYIRYNYTIGHHSFTGSLLTLNDIKLDLYKIALPYYFIYSSNIDYSWAYFDPNSQNVFINLSFFDEFKGHISLLKDENLEQVSFLISLVLIHERGGHSKVDEINNENNSPRYYYLDNFKISIIKHKESGYFVEEVIYSGNLVSLLMNYENFPLSLKNVDLFVQSNFDKLNELLIANDIKNESDDIDDINDIKNSKKPKKKILRKKRKMCSMRGYLFSKFNFFIQGKKYDKNFYNDPEYQLFLNLEKNTKRKKY